MTKKKSFLRIMLALVLIIPCMFFMTACGETSGGSDGGSGGTGGTGGGTGGTGSSGGASQAVAVQTVKDNFGTNFEITISTAFSTETVIRDGDACLIKMGNFETLYYDGGEYFRNSPTAKFYLDDEITDYNIASITWNESTFGTSILMYYSGYGFDPDEGWVSSATTFLGRAVTKYTLTGSASVYIDNATGATFKFEGVGPASMGDFEITAFSQGTSDLSTFVDAIEFEAE